MKIYTGTGDQGTTGLLSGERIPKDHPRAEANGTVDELDSILGLLISALDPAQAALVEELKTIQSTLFRVGSWLGTTAGSDSRRDLKRLTEEESHLLEEAIDRMVSALPPLSGFILPGGHSTAALAHVARTVCRRAERRVVALAEQDADTDLKGVLVYLNRLSDYCFVLARHINRIRDVSETAKEP